MKLFNDNKFIIGMVHLEALPGSPLFKGSIEDVYSKALTDAKSLKDGGITAIMVENAGDIPFPKKMDMVQVSCMAAISKKIRDETKIPVGIDAAFCDYKAAFASAKAAQSDFVRLAVFVDSVATSTGVIEACSASALRYRKQIDAEEIAVFADVQVKYSHMLVDKISIEESAKNAESSLADAIIVTGAYSGNETPIEVLKRVKKVVNVPVIVGSGLNETNVKEQMEYADGAIVGTSLKIKVEDGLMIDVNKVKKLMENLKGEK
jgi:membrane complex biogenesis BtpA family protein